MRETLSSVRSHPSDELLEAYATGRLPAAPRVTFAAHVEWCHRCRVHIREIEEEQGRRLDALPGIPLSRDALSHMTTGLDRAPHLVPRVVNEERYLDDVRLPAGVRRAGLHAPRWMKPGLWAARVRAPKDDGWRTFLLRAPAGTTIPQHGHAGGEITAVLTGAYRDDRVYSAGDFVETADGCDHRLEVTPDAHCVCLISMQGSIPWRGWSKMITPILGM